ncbi:hypothetical protein [Mycolicibacterium moriokaense]|uniref:Transmembrane protein n=1 Tax=Mycolicibacterium moriokaense TaxID=39691 RepID=A0A318HP48_9MYCO|nr:hypothetical protein [Mycolicibacterium moriokaense]PXX13262.1 hypothetical protein C8E89_101415 [Mycolicibacterium moriokaense]
MGRTVAVVWHASFSIAAGVLYFFFVLPRWPELLGETSHTLGTVLRIVAGALIGLAALPVVFTLLRTRRPEFGTPKLALTLRTSSIALHVLAGVLIVGTAISEIWFTVDSAGQWLFGIYGAAAAIALLGIFAFYVSFAAELPPPPPKPLKAKKAKQGRRGRRKAAEEAADDPDEDVAEDATDDEGEDGSEPESDEKPAEVTAEAEEPASTADAPEPAAEEDKAAEDEASEAGAPGSTNGRLRNRRRRRLRGGVAVED